MSPLVLIVDDERDYVMMLEMACKSAGFTCLCAHDGKTGKRLLDEHDVADEQIDVVVVE